MQTTEFNFLGIYTLRLPLIVTLGIFAFGGVFIGMLLSYGNNLSLKSELKKLRKELSQSQKKQEQPVNN